MPGARARRSLLGPQEEKQKLYREVRLATESPQNRWTFDCVLATALRTTLASLFYRECDACWYPSPLGCSDCAQLLPRYTVGEVLPFPRGGLLVATEAPAPCACLPVHPSSPAAGPAALPAHLQRAPRLRRPAGPVRGSVSVQGCCSLLASSLKSVAQYECAEGLRWS